ncbi:uncharacterized protein LOC111300592 [Durio zibethinus]|uniref:Uncharacterized protein LOC111300592 n=1 Tax=Durio zibethinus TaxID=66656 RepID=A0A6P5ZGU2_DURZI|nr:uncharacterized protein LOC111300592 [Durio zibethinus]
MCWTVHFACANALTMTHARTIRQPFSRAIVCIVKFTSRRQFKIKGLGTQNWLGLASLAWTSPELYNNLTLPIVHPNSLAPSLLQPSFSPSSSLLSMANALNQTNIPTFNGKERKSYQDPLMGNALHEPLPSSQRSRGNRRRKEYLKAQKKDCLSEKQGEGEDDDDEKTEVKRKIVALQRIVPGGETLGVDKLFEETAEYILALQCQIKAMRVLTGLIEGLEKKKRKLGG